MGKTYFCPSAAAAPAPAGSTPAAGGADAGQTPAVDTAAQPLTVEMDVTGGQQLLC